jgi:hypothetical protein
VANVAVVLVVFLGVSGVVAFLRRHRRGIVAERGMSIGADLGALADQRQVQVRAVTAEGADRVRLLLAPCPLEGPELGAGPDLDVIVSLRDGDFGLELLQQWHRNQDLLALVLPPASQLVRLRSIADLQPLTLRRIDPPD